MDKPTENGFAIEITVEDEIEKDNPSEKELPLIIIHDENEYSKDDREIPKDNRKNPSDNEYSKDNRENPCDNGLELGRNMDSIDYQNNIIITEESSSRSITIFEEIRTIDREQNEADTIVSGEIERLTKKAQSMLIYTAFSI